MSEDRLKNEPPVGENKLGQGSRWMGVWEGISRAGLADITYRLGTHVLLIAFILLVAWVLRGVYVQAQASSASDRDVLTGASIDGGSLSSTNDESRSPAEIPVSLPDFQAGSGGEAAEAGISRFAQPHTDVPSRPRSEVTKYTVQVGDTLFGIAEKFGLKPESILWANQFVLGDNPHNLQPGQVLNILPVDGAYHRWSVGDGLNGVAKFFGVDPQEIVDFPGNHLDPQTIGDYSNPNIQAGTWLIIPGGQRAFVNWSAPEIPRDNPGVAKVLGPGACSAVANGAIGSGTFVWPANSHFLSGFDYNPSANHSGIDIDGNTGDPVYAADNGVVVYAGWNNWGYGNVIVINHGNGWQTLYAHLSQIYVDCGQSVYQTNIIGAIGNTGNSSGSHLHFEMMYNGTKVNPHDYLP
jgi:murein DD-endopeptidase MepM/ murein hydrolase activator NlpD